MRTVSSTFREAINGQETGEVFIALLTIDHDDLATPIRICGDAQDTVSRGNVFTAFPFQLTLPGEPESGPPTMRIIIDNVERTLVETIRNISTPPEVTIEVVLASAPDTVELSWFNYEMTTVEYNAFTITATLSIRTFDTEPFPGVRYLPSTHPGLF